jgi:hypothetical protein
VSRGRWPGGIDKPIAVLRADPAELSRRYKVRFSPGQDDLDEFHEAGLKLKSGRQVLLMRYQRSPGPGTTVSVDRLDDATDALRELRETLQLRRREIAWVSNDVVEKSGGSSITGIAPAVSTLISGWVTALIGKAHRSA